MFREVGMLFDRWNMDLDDALQLFVGMTTENFKERYRLSGTGFLQEEGFDPTGPSGTVKATGSYDVTYPLKGYGASMGWTDITLGYMTLAEFEMHVQTVINMNNNTVFRDVLYAIFNNAPPAYLDPIRGSLTLVPLANGDSVVYPPVFGSTTEATENLYLAPNYAESGISATNNPFVQARDKLETHWGYPQGGSTIFSLVNNTATQYIRLLPGFDEYPNEFVSYGDNVSLGNRNLPRAPAGGRFVGTVDGVAICEWPRIPTGWIVTIHADAPPPLKRRVDPADTGIPRGLNVRTRTMDSPLSTTSWRNRYGFGVANRLSVVVTALNSTSSYSIPTAYA
jgi:hypothetical protein